VASRFGRQRDPRFGTTTVSNGITLAADAGTAVRAVHPGTVVFAGTFTGFGQLVIVDHGQHAYSLYGYLSLVGVQRGATVEAGTVVGQVGDAPDGRGGLYLEVRIDGRPVNPLEWLSRAQ
jgi:septal ring factor EnvC (AmiA/AmiB activator)